MIRALEGIVRDFDSDSLTNKFREYEFKSFKSFLLFCLI